MESRPSEPLLRVDDLRVAFETDRGVLRAVDGVSFDVRPGEVLGLVGESGCGKSVTALAVLRLIARPTGRIESGRIFFKGRDLLSLPAAEMRSIRGAGISMIFQDPMTALSPLHRVGKQMVEACRLHRNMPLPEAEALAEDWLRRVGIPGPRERLLSYPFELSGGMRQRVMIAMALMHRPALVIADEPTTALDVTVQAQVFDVMMTAKDRDTSVLLITHDMGVVWERCERVLVMYASRIAEEGRVDEIFASPRHPYTQGLLDSLPSRQRRSERLKTIPGQVPSPLAWPPGCRFSDRCPFSFDRCRRECPPLYDVGSAHRSACFLCDPAEAGRSRMPNRP